MKNERSLKDSIPKIENPIEIKPQSQLGEISNKRGLRKTTRGIKRIVRESDDQPPEKNKLTKNDG